MVLEVLQRAEPLALPDLYLTAGCLFQTVWNHLHHYASDKGILDYDLFYCDPTDLSWEAEDEVIKRSAAAFNDLGVEVQIRNQARVHLWFGEHFGIPIAPFVSSRDAIRNFLAIACCLGIRTNHDDIEVYSPFGTGDLFELIVRRNPDARRPPVRIREEDGALGSALASAHDLAVGLITLVPDAWTHFRLRRLDHRQRNAHSECRDGARY